jgi:hypothetical protein
MAYILRIPFRRLQAEARHDGIQCNQQQGAGGGADEQAYGQGQLQGSMVQVCETCRDDEQKGEQIEGRMHGVISRRKANGSTVNGPQRQGEARGDKYLSTVDRCHNRPDELIFRKFSRCGRPGIGLPAEGHH